MPGGYDTSCLYSTVRNSSGREMPFGFLPPHGRRLAVGEEFTVYGDIRQAVIRHERTEGRRSIIAFEEALQNGLIEILNTPPPIFLDAGSDDVKMLRLSGGTLGVVDPCWRNSVSSPPIG